MSISTNSIVLGGYVTNDPTKGTVEGGRVWCRLRIGTWFSKDKTIFTSISTWGDLAEWCYENVRKGNGIIVTGRLDNYMWDKQGVSTFGSQVVASRVDIASRKHEVEIPLPPDDSDIPF